jgi:hypothetical protein
MLRFEQRGKLAELPDDLVGGRDVFVLTSCFASSHPNGK